MHLLPMDKSIEFRKMRDAMFARDIPADLRAMSTEDLLTAVKTEPFIDPFKYLELRRRGVNP
jgi:hypothetical protein